MAITRHRRIRDRGGFAVLLVLAMVVLTACGGSSAIQASSASDTKPGVHSATTAQPGPVASASRSNGAGESRRRSGSIPSRRPPHIRNHHQPARAIHTRDDDEGKAVAAPNPCRLVTRSEAAAIVRSRVLAPQVGAQGPTCIYRSPRAKRFVTLAVMSMDVSAVTRKARKDVIRATVAGRRAFCVNSGGLKLYVPLTGSSVLNVGAPCPVAARFAAKALGRLKR